MFHRVHIVTLAAVILICAYAYAQVCTDPNERYDICGPLCAPTCDNPRPISIFCPGIICIRDITSGCRCKEGYVRDQNSVNKSCVLLANCTR